MVIALDIDYQGLKEQVLSLETGFFLRGWLKGVSRKGYYRSRGMSSSNKPNKARNSNRYRSFEKTMESLPKG